MQTEWKPPQKFDEYEIIKQLGEGEGAMGDVYLAHDTSLERKVALKFIREVEPDDEMLQMFRQEARALARLSHPNVVAVHRMGKVDGKPFIDFEYIDGNNLKQLIKPIDWQEALKLGIDLARGLGAVHTQNVLHRDIKPANAIIDKHGKAKLLDFGIAKIIDPVWKSEHPGQPAHLDEPPYIPVDRMAATLPAPDKTLTTPNLLISPALGRGGADMHRTLISGSEPASAGPVRVPSSASEFPETRLRGTPFYMAPERWMGRKATPRSDIYSLGVVLYELCTGQPPHSGAKPHELRYAVLHNDIPRLERAVAGIDAEFASIVHRCLERDPEARYASGTELENALKDLRRRRDDQHGDTKSRLSMRLPGNPYRGLLPFDAAHESLFFGRDADIMAIIERLLRHKLIIVAGDSGVGKSSLCKAGVLPKLADHLEQKNSWLTVSVTPGKDPMQNVIHALASALKLDVLRLQFKLASNPEQALRDIHHRLGEDRGLVLFIDQLEELVTISDSAQAKQAEDFIAKLLEQIPEARMLATVRADFLGKIAGFMQIGRVLPRALFFPGKMTSAQLRETIVGPARSRGVEFESEELIESLIKYTEKSECGLPLLQFALSELWDALSPGATIITKQALDAIGGVGGALARHADQVWLGLPDEAKQSARRMITSLVTPEGTRARCSRNDLLWKDPHALEVLTILENARLLVALTSGGGTEYQLAHDVLIKEWETLQGWLADRVKSRAVRENIRKEAMEWDRLLKDGNANRARELLWRKHRLAEAAHVDRNSLSDVEQAFFDASRKAEQWFTVLKTGLLVGIPAALLLVYSGFELKARAEQDKARQTLAAEIDTRMQEAKQGLLETQRQKEAFTQARQAAIDIFYRDLWLGEARWEEVRSMAQAVDRGYADAIQKLEAAFLKDSARADVKKALADAYGQRVIFSEETEQSPLPWMERLELYDETGEYRAKLSKEGHLHLRVIPDGARVSVERFVRSKGGGWTVESAGIDSTKEFSDLRLGAGSYRLIIQNKGFGTVLYPITVARAEEIDLKIELPMPQSIPEGFVYIPEGRFYFGAASMNTADDRFRRTFLATLPEHIAETPGFLIAKHETTYSEWIEYLEALPEQEQKRWEERGMQAGMRGFVGLSRNKEDKWELSFSVNQKLYKAQAGELIRFDGRKERAEQHWGSFPVMGISAVEAERYTQWLASSGRLPGARLCTEKEWERAARGADRRLYPQGDTLDGQEANFQESYQSKDGKILGMGPDEVGSRPLSRSPFGLDDIAGNVFEWVRSSLPGNTHTLRGGGYFFDRASALSMNRNLADPHVSDPNGGLRVCADLVRN